MAIEGNALANIFNMPVLFAMLRGQTNEKSIHNLILLCKGRPTFISTACTIVYIYMQVSALD